MSILLQVLIASLIILIVFEFVLLKKAIRKETIKAIRICCHEIYGFISLRAETGLTSKEKYQQKIGKLGETLKQIYDQNWLSPCRDLYYTFKMNAESILREFEREDTANIKASALDEFAELPELMISISAMFRVLSIFISQRRFRLKGFKAVIQFQLTLYQMAHAIKAKDYEFTSVRYFG